MSCVKEVTKNSFMYQDCTWYILSFNHRLKMNVFVLSTVEFKWTPPVGIKLTSYIDIKTIFQSKCFFNQTFFSQTFVACSYFLDTFLTSYWSYCWCPYDICNFSKSGIFMLCHNIDPMLTSNWGLSAHYKVP